MQSMLVSNFLFDSVKLDYPPNALSILTEIRA